jgi:hypothetical protein
MNANEISPKANPRLKRIKTISQFLKIFFLLYLVCSGLENSLSYILVGFRMGMWSWFILGPTNAYLLQTSMIGVLIVLVATALFLATVVSCYQLLNLYEKGIVFSATNVQLLGRIGYLAFGYGLINLLERALVGMHHIYDAPHTPDSVWPVIMLGVQACLSSPWLIGGFFVMIISQIMDEGRKIQEEQALTV